MAPIPLPDASSAIQILQSASSIPLLSSRLIPPRSSIPLSIRSSLPSLPNLKHLLPRQTQVFSIPSSYAGLNAGPAPGAVVGAVLGSVGGFLLLLWLIYTCYPLGATTEVVEEEIIHERRRSGRRSHSRARSEVIEIVRSRTPPRVRRDTIVVEESTTSRPVVEAEEDIVEVIEDHSPPRRVRSHRQSGFRTVDPDEFGGGGRPLRKVSRR